MIESITTFGASTFGVAWPTVWAVARIVALLVPLLLCVAYLTLWERKAIGSGPGGSGSSRWPCAPRA